MYIAIEGVDCVGKSTQIALLKQVLKNAIFTIEPGGTTLGKYLRELLLHKHYALGRRTEFLLFLADRAQHYEEILSIHTDKLIISDRSFISGMAYARKIETDSLNVLFELNAFALNNFFPQKVIFLQGDEALISSRLLQKKQDKIEKNGSQYFLEVQDEIVKILHFLEEKINLKYIKLDAAQPKENLHQQIKDFIND
ncbi:dTMP kinase [Campylobacter sp. MIT 21-1685]|uniref:dTMP kinase n=1 Tax=unclassified Campylobacter TaxID=2593542 RepID=UPI00224A6CF3|nr:MULTISPECIES: dTMP kinase [unclassified Campylobacter]MCX2683577.1 dTMP kinase [Campylobacter sp. MIT 21-1684]MCX2751860.1 dTMP kinase [Campylobacter sp. MIT 21-1682]MCX2808087.1 dTMP kinase [Campylobacter sp. MIT 21-1685]